MDRPAQARGPGAAPPGPRGLRRYRRAAEVSSAGRAGSGPEAWPGSPPSRARGLGLSAPPETGRAGRGGPLPEGRRWGPGAPGPLRDQPQDASDPEAAAAPAALECPYLPAAPSRAR